MQLNEYQNTLEGMFVNWVENILIDKKLNVETCSSIRCADSSAKSKITKCELEISAVRPETRVVPL